MGRNQPFPLIHDLPKLVMLCAALEPAFNEFLDDAASLNPFAVEMRYDAEFWPSAQETDAAINQARHIYDFVQKALGKIVMPAHTDKLADWTEFQSF